MRALHVRSPFRSLTRSFVAVATLVSLTACGGGDGGDGGADVTSATEVATTSAADATVAPVDTGGLTTDPPATEALTTDPPPSTVAETTVPPAEDLPVLTFTPQSAGPLQVTASQCTVEGIPNGVPGAGIESLAIDATHAFVPTAGGVAALAFTGGAGCSMVLDPTVGDAGLLATDDEVSTVSVSAGGRLAAGGVFGTTVFDVAAGQSYACDQATGDVEISDDGALLMTSFPGADVEQFALSDTTCGEATVVAVPADVVDVYYVAFDGADLFLGGQGPDDTVYATRVAGGAVQWKVGNPETGGPGWIGWVHGMAPCDGGFCIVDTNTDKLIVTDAAGVLRAEFAISDLIGERMFYDDLEVGADGALYLLATDGADDGAGGTNEGNYVVRIEVTG
jgi:hypothetical protein